MPSLCFFNPWLMEQGRLLAQPYNLVFKRFPDDFSRLDFKSTCWVRPVTCLFTLIQITTMVCIIFCVWLLLSVTFQHYCFLTLSQFNTIVCWVYSFEICPWSLSNISIHPVSYTSVLLHKQKLCQTGKIAGKWSEWEVANWHWSSNAWWGKL